MTHTFIHIIRVSIDTLHTWTGYTYADGILYDTMYWVFT